MRKLNIEKCFVGFKMTHYRVIVSMWFGAWLMSNRLLTYLLDNDEVYHGYYLKMETIVWKKQHLVLFSLVMQGRKRRTRRRCHWCWWGRWWELTRWSCTVKRINSKTNWNDRRKKSKTQGDRGEVCSRWNISSVIKTSMANSWTRNIWNCLGRVNKLYRAVFPDKNVTTLWKFREFPNFREHF